MVKKLSHWTIERYPAFIDKESLTAIELVARLEGSFNSLIDNYNLFIDNINKEIEEFETETNKNYEEFTNNINKIVHDYIHSIDTKIANQDLIIESAKEYMETNLNETINNLFNELLASGGIHAALNTSYDELTESLNFVYTESEE